MKWLRLLGLLMCLPLSAASIYVSTTGDDSSGDGSIVSPYATLEKARNVASSGDTVYVRGGTYYRTNTFELASTNSGLTFRVYPGETASLVGGLPIINWTVYSGSIYQSDVSTQGLSGVNFRQLLFNGRRQHLARYPNYDAGDPIYGGWLYIASASTTTNFTYAAGDARTWTNASDGEVVVFPADNWINRISSIYSNDTSGKVLWLNTSTTYAMEAGNRYYVRGFMEELDAPGEWWLNTNNDTVYFWSPSDVSAGAVIVPVATNIFAIGAGTTNVTIHRLDLSICIGTAVTLTTTTNCVVSGCTIHDAGGYSGSGITVSGGYSNGVVGNDLARIGYNGITANGGITASLTPASNYIDNNWIIDVGEVRKEGNGIITYGVGQRVSHNLISHVPSIGIRFSAGQKFLIEYNHVYDAMLEMDDGGAIYSYGGLPSGADYISSRGSIVQHNLATDTLGYGYYSGVETNPWNASGIYLDGLTCGIDLIGNVISNCSFAGIFVNGGRDNVIHNNLILDCDANQLHYVCYKTNTESWTKNYSYMLSNHAALVGEPAWAGMRGFDVSPSNAWNAVGRTMGSNDFSTNIISYTNLVAPTYPRTYAKYAYEVQIESNRWDYNVVWHNNLIVTNKDYATDYVWGGWQALGADLNSSTNDPLIEANVQLNAASPALALGFQQIDTNWGCYYSSDRATWPLGERGMRYLRAGTIRAGTLRGP